VGVPKKRTSKMRRDRRRAANSNLRVAVQVIKCPNCNEPALPHRACGECGYYKGRELFPTAAGA
jgi:large subunit ribosomal protein L32